MHLPSCPLLVPSSIPVPSWIPVAGQELPCPFAPVTVLERPFFQASVPVSGCGKNDSGVRGPPSETEAHAPRVGAPPGPRLCLMHVSLGTLPEPLLTYIFHLELWVFTPIKRP